MATGAENGNEGNKVAEIKKGSVVINVFKSQNSRKFPKEPVAGTMAAE